jgi:hypothetical protein
MTNLSASTLPALLLLATAALLASTLAGGGWVRRRGGAAAGAGGGLWGARRHPDPDRALLPWVTLFRGLQPIPGFQLDGGCLAGIAIAAVSFTIVAARSGGSRLLRPLAGLGAAIVTVDALSVVNRIAAFVANPGPSGPLSQPTAGSGAPVMALGGVFVLIATIVAPARAGALSSGLAPRLTIGAALFAAGWIHLVLAPQHLAESALLGAGFLGAGLAQLILAATVLLRPRAWIYYGVIVVNVALIFFYGVAVAVGLPFGAHDHGSGIILGSGEAIDLPGVISKGAELVSLVLAFWLLGRTNPVLTVPANHDT